MWLVTSRRPPLFLLHAPLQRGPPRPPSMRTAEKPTLQTLFAAVGTQINLFLIILFKHYSGARGFQSFFCERPTLDGGERPRTAEHYPPPLPFFFFLIHERKTNEGGCFFPLCCLLTLLKTGNRCFFFGVVVGAVRARAGVGAFALLSCSPAPRGALRVFRPRFYRC